MQRANEAGRGSSDGCTDGSEQEAAAGRGQFLSNATPDSVLHRRKWKNLHRLAGAIEMEVEVVKLDRAVLSI